MEDAKGFMRKDEAIKRYDDSSSSAVVRRYEIWHWLPEIWTGLIVSKNADGCLESSFEQKISC